MFCLFCPSVFLSVFLYFVYERYNNKKSACDQLKNVRRLIRLLSAFHGSAGRLEQTTKWQTSPLVRNPRSRWSSSLSKIWLESIQYFRLCKNTRGTPQSLLCENMTSCIKPEVYNASQRRQRKTEPRPQTTCIKNWQSLAVWFHRYTNGQTNKQTDKQTRSSQYFARLSGGVRTVILATIRRRGRWRVGQRIESFTHILIRSSDATCLNTSTTLYTPELSGCLHRPCYESAKTCHENANIFSTKVQM